MYDTIIIGSGPAGLSAAVNLKARNRKVLVLGRDISTSFLYKAEKVDNHLGMPGMTGKEMLDSFLAHSAKMDIEIKEGRVLQILPMGKYFGVNFENDFLQAKTVILATGIKKGKKIPGEDEYLGKGVSYCATCDGMLYRNKPVFVIGEIKEAEEDVNFLSNLASKVYYLPKYGVSEIHYNEKVEIMKGIPKAVKGSAFVEGVQVDNEHIPCQGVFFIKESMPADSLIEGLKTENGTISVSRFMETNINGVFACGDCIGWPYQISNAVGEGLVAGQQADKFLSNLEKQEA